MDEKIFARLVKKMRILNQERQRLNVMLKLIEAETMRLYNIISDKDDNEKLRNKLYDIRINEGWYGTEENEK